MWLFILFSVNTKQLATCRLLGARLLNRARPSSDVLGIGWWGEEQLAPTGSSAGTDN
jgi:hypothetical protein